MHNHFMARAIALSIENVRSGRGGPFAALIVEDGKVVAEAVNCVTASNDPTAHAEVTAIRAACGAAGKFDLAGSVMYASCEPCPMCLGAIYWARLDRVYFANTAADAANAGFDDALIYRELARPFADRKIPLIPLMRDEALEAFRAWEAQRDKIGY
ncbi:MAG: nucleoside deaminase [Acidobacteriia bacterium]|nr:nucleoside deaminase [Terriglobia bacterium]